jgi:hypothetical protein
MYCLEVEVNGERVCLVGKEQAQNYHATVTYWGGRNFVEVSANGASDMVDQITETFSWGNQKLKAGDVVTIKIIDCDNPDQPIEINRHDHSQGMRDLEEKIVEMTAKIRVRMEVEGKEAVLREEVHEGMYCSFCGKEKEEVGRMISGPSVYICYECVSICNELLDDRDAKEESPKWPKRD